MANVFLAVPTYDQKIDTGVLQGILSPSRRHRIVPAAQPGSLLGKTFNQLWIGGVLSGCDYFAMLHADIEPDIYWIDTLVQELEDTGSDVLSATVLIKNDTGEYSTGLGHPGRPCHYRLTSDHFDALPVTFDSDDLRRVSGRTGNLCVNTGCWVCRLKQSWTRQVHFNVTTWIDWTQDPPRAESIPEDWAFSHMVRSLGGRVRGTKLVGTTHHGRYEYRQPAIRCDSQEQTPQKSTPPSPDIDLQKEVIDEHLKRHQRRQRNSRQKRRARK